jgi:heptosyltransferase III
MKEKSKVLIYLFGSLGDAVVAIPALRAARRHYHDSEFVLLQNVQSGNFVRASEVIPDGLIDRCLDYSSELTGIGKVFGFAKLWYRLRRERFRAVVYLVISERAESSVSRDKRFFRLCGISETIGFHAFSQQELYPIDEFGQPATTMHEADRKLERLKRDGVEMSRLDDMEMPFYPVTQDQTERVGTWLSVRRRSPQSKLIAIAPGCKTISNQWPLENFQAIGQSLISRFDCEIILVGGPADFGACEDLIRAWGRGINAAGQFSIKDSAALLAKCDIYLGLDTGSTHLAAAMGVPCFAIYGERNNPGQWYPMGTGNVVIRHPVKCSGCRSFHCPVAGHPCISGITVDAVFRGLSSIIGHIPGKEYKNNFTV